LELCLYEKWFFEDKMILMVKLMMFGYLIMH
jgi:hypothetical protein